MQAQARVSTRAVTRSACGPLDPFRHLIVAREVIEASNRRVELDIDGARRPVALLADDDLGLAVHAGRLHLPFRMLGRAAAPCCSSSILHGTRKEPRRRPARSNPTRAGPRVAAACRPGSRPGATVARAPGSAR